MNNCHDARGIPVSERDNDPVIGRLARRPGIAGVAARQGHRWNIGADAVGGVLLLVALALPWNLYFGMGIAGSSKAVLGVVMVVTVLSVGLLAATCAGRLARWLVGARMIGYASIVGAALSFMFVLFWRVRYALPSSAGTSGFGKQNIAVVVTAVVYGVVALAAVVVASSWIVQAGQPSRLVTVALG